MIIQQTIGKTTIPILSELSQSTMDPLFYFFEGLDDGRRCIISHYLILYGIHNVMHGFL
jgi:hypothetical protein